MIKVIGMYNITLILPEDMTELEDKFAEVMAEIVSQKLTNAELEIFIKKLEADNREEL